MAQQTILIIDDHAGVRGLLVALCTDAGLRTVTADTCLGGIQALRDTPCDLVILDTAMPDLSGIEALEALQQVRPHIPIIITTDRGIDDGVKSLLGAGAAMCLEKPFDVAFVDRALRNSLR